MDLIIFKAEECDNVNINKYINGIKNKKLDNNDKLIYTKTINSLIKISINKLNTKNSKWCHRNDIDIN